MFWRGFLVNGDPGPSVQAARDIVRIYPLGASADSAEMKFFNSSGKFFNTIHANDSHFYAEVGEVIDEEPVVAFSPELLGLLAGIGIEKGRPFAPDSRMRAILEEAVAVGNATARAISFRTRDPRAFFYEDSAWFNPFVGGSYEFLRESGARDLDARTMFHYPYTAVTPAMAARCISSSATLGKSLTACHWQKPVTRARRASTGCHRERSCCQAVAYSVSWTSALIRRS